MPFCLLIMNPASFWVYHTTFYAGSMAFSRMAAKNDFFIGHKNATLCELCFVCACNTMSKYMLLRLPSPKMDKLWRSEAC